MPTSSVAENLQFRAGVHGTGRAAIAATMARFGLDAVAATRFGALSGGWARRVQFAATLLDAPPLLLLDEPTAGLDIATRRAIWAWLATHAAEGHAVVISTHDLAEAERCASLLIYDDGRAGPQQPLAALLAEHGAATLEDAIARLAA